jgi:hypothetical protein
MSPTAMVLPPVILRDVVDAVGLFSPGVARPDSTWHAIESSSARRGQRGQCSWRSVALAGYLKGLCVDGRIDAIGPSLHEV